MAGKISFLIAILFVLMITGCGGDKSSSASSSKGGGVVRTDYSPSEPTSSDAITLKITAVAGEHPEYNWIVNGITVPVSGNKLDPEHFSKNDTVFCSILIGGEEKKKVGPIVIKNSPPRINSLGISPDSPKHGIDLSINANVDDVDRDDVTFLVKWFVNEEEVGSGEALSGSEIKAADQVYALVTPFDGTDEGLPINSGFVLIQNSPPEIVSPQPSIEGRIMDYEIEVNDGDGDNFDLSLEQGPNGMKLDGNRLIWEVPDPDKDTSIVIKIKAKDERGGETSVSFSLDLIRSEMQ
jgi:hypothetical protein